MSFIYSELQKQTNLTPLMIATVLNEEQFVEDLLSLGENIDEINSHEETALHLAFQEGNAEILEKLILNGGDLKAVSFTGNVVYENLHALLNSSGEELSLNESKMKSLALKYAKSPLSADEHVLIKKIKEANALRVVEGMSPDEMKKNPKLTDIANFFRFMDKNHLIQSVREYIGFEKFRQKKELNEILLGYPISLMPTPFMESGEENLISNKLLKKISMILPPHRYLSSSWLKSQQLNFSLSEEEKDFVQLSEKFIRDHQRQYTYIQKNPTFENIRKIGLANCGELADACLHEQEGNNSLVPELKNVSFLRANIKVNLPSDKLKEKGLNEKLNEFQHVFLICEEGIGKSMGEMIQNLNKQKSQSLDIWKRRAGYTKNLIVNHMLEAGVSDAQLELIHPITGEKQEMKLQYTKEERKLSILPVSKNLAFEKERAL
ncbi:MAG: hypothetical protein J6V53_00190 [Alphaproteobacteria bacterium]|nr:hypothetical protein [Alphaproteobacteria bacterium]